MQNYWITNIQRLLTMDITESSILIIRLATITFDDKKNCTVNTGVHAGYVRRINDNEIEWHIHDHDDDTLIIPTDVSTGDLGNLRIDDDVNGGVIYVITGCKIISNNNNPEENFAIKQTDGTTIAFAETAREATLLTNALNNNHISVDIINNIMLKHFCKNT